MFSSAYYDKLDGLQDREKYRIRFYNFNKDYIALEKKVKNDELSYKKTAVINEKLCEDIINKNVFGLLDMNNQLLREFYTEVRLRNMQPRILVDYYRTAFEFPAGDTRITIDENLKTALWNTSLFDEYIPLIPALNNGEAILEVKYNKVIPLHVIKILDCIDKERCAISKYALCSRYLH
jgi:SPX domain protein involved in polyphosphate accumulation